MSKFRGSITLSIFSLSTLSNYHYWQSPKTRYWRLVRPYQTGIPPARLLALIWAHNPDFYFCFHSIDNMYEFASSHCTDFKDLRDDEDIVINREWILKKLTEEEN